MINKRETIENMVKAIHECLKDGVVFITHLTEKGQMITFYNLDREPLEGIERTDAIYSFERTTEGVVDYVKFNPEFYPETENEVISKN